MGLAAVLQDIVTLQNPFNFLERDSDVEGMSDGFDNGTAYGETLSTLPGVPLPTGLQVSRRPSLSTHPALLYICRVQ